MTSYDESGSIGKRYRRADACGTPWCLTVDDETINNGTVTLRDRDTMEQITLKLDEVASYINEKIFAGKGWWLHIPAKTFIGVAIILSGCSWVLRL